MTFLVFIIAALALLLSVTALLSAALAIKILKRMLEEFHNRTIEEFAELD